MTVTDPDAPASGVQARYSFAKNHRVAFSVLCASFACIFALASLAMLTHAPLIFPSLGATIFLLLSAWRTDAASPRNVLYGHAIAIVCGYVALLVLMAFAIHRLQGRQYPVWKQQLMLDDPARAR